MDFASLTGIVAGTLMVIAAMFVGGTPSDYFNAPGLMIVIGGTVSATLLNFRFNAVIRAYRAVGHVFTTERENPIDTLTEVMRINNIAKKQGALELDNYIKSTGSIRTGNRIIKKAAMLSIDNLSEEDTVISLRAEIDNIKIQNTIDQEVFKKMAGYAPAMGMIGTLIGLVQMLGKMTDPAQLGPAMGLWRY
jgi:chemotaxis protein MotA